MKRKPDKELQNRLSLKPEGKGFGVPESDQPEGKGFESLESDQPEGKDSESPESDHPDQELEQALQSSLLELDRLTSTATPPLLWFEQLALEQQRTQRKRAKRDLIGFLCIAPFVISSSIASMLYGIGAFVVFQLAVLAALLIPIAWRRRKQVDGR